MNKTALFLFASLFFYGCNSAKINSVKTSSGILSKQEKDAGWQLLFDGKTSNGWHGYGRQEVPKAWKVVNGELHFDAAAKKNDSSQGGDIITDEEFENFDLKLEWKISKNGNSGIMFYVKEDPAYTSPYFTGPEMQILDNLGHRDSEIHKHKAGDLYDLIASSSDATKPVGEWNQVEIIANRGKLDFYLNSQHIVSTTMWDDNWRKMIAESKFKAWPDFGTFKKGRIDLQDHGDDVWFRNIKIKRL